MAVAAEAGTAKEGAGVTVEELWPSTPAPDHKGAAAAGAAVQALLRRAGGGAISACDYVASGEAVGRCRLTLCGPHVDPMLIPC